MKLPQTVNLSVKNLELMDDFEMLVPFTLNELWLYIGFYSTELYLESGSEVIYLLELVFQSPWVVQLLSED